MQALARIGRLLVCPSSEWDLIAAEQTAPAIVLRVYVLPLALLAPIATVLGMKFFGRDWSPVHGYLVPADRILATGATTYVAIVISIPMLALVFSMLAPMLGGKSDYKSALALAAYGAIPLMLAGATLLLPAMATVCLVALCHSLYLFWLGSGRLLNVSPGKGAEFVCISMVLFGLLSALAGAAASALGMF